MSDPLASTADAELRAHLERILGGLYDLGAEIGRGGMGVVYRARDLKLKRTVAIKVLPPELGFRAEIRTRFLREAETAAQLSHPNIVPIYSVDEKDGIVFFVMSLIEGQNLAHWIHDHGAMEPERARRLLRDVADALAYAHAQGVVHRDVKPDNILLDKSSGRPMVTDFGIARAITEGADSRLTATGIAIGTPAYMSPEQSAGDKQIDGRSDLYSLGVVAYQVLSGDLPFIASSTPAMLVKHLSEQPMPLHLKRSSVPRELADVVMCLLAKDPADRFENATALVDALDGGGNIPVARPRSTPTWSPMPAAAADSDAPTQDELMRWSAPAVQAFRKKLPTFIAVNAVILVISLFSQSGDLFSITAFWSVYLAFKYAKLWSEGYDWRDVFRQKRDRMAFDVLGEWIEDIQAIFSSTKRAEVRARWRARRLQPGLMTPAVGELTGAARAALPAPGASGKPSKPGKRGLTNAELSAMGAARRDVALRAEQDRNELLQLVASLPDRERKQLKDINETAKALEQRVRSLSLGLSEIDRTTPKGGSDALEREIAQLEAQANPLDRDASEARVRRLALLKRDRRAVGDRVKKRADLEAKLESCSLALQNLRFDVLRLKTGGSSTQSVTHVAERAMSLARDVEGMIAVNELGKQSGPKA
ncbi:MAG TPA: protein kinase [Gemmatimonadaceae bacterium]|nr:protein kinase [Gemmatimonadaceae bacterium]